MNLHTEHNHQPLSFSRNPFWMGREASTHSAGPGQAGTGLVQKILSGWREDRWWIMQAKWRIVWIVQTLFRKETFAPHPSPLFSGGPSHVFLWLVPAPNYQEIPISRAGPFCQSATVSGRASTQAACARGSCRHRAAVFPRPCPWAFFSHKMAVYLARFQPLLT